MRFKILMAAAVAVVVGAMAPSPASAQESAEVTANIVGLEGTRTLILAEELTGVSLVAAGGLTSSISGAFTAQVDEVAAAGDNSYSVTAELENLTSATNDVIGYENVDLAPGAMVDIPLAGNDEPGTGGAFADAATPGSVSAAQTVWTNTGQDPATYITALHTNTSTLGLTLPNGAKAGTYTGTLTVTLVL